MKQLASNFTLSQAIIKSQTIPHFGIPQSQSQFTRSPMVQQQKGTKISLQQYQLHQKLLLLQIQIQLQNVFHVVRNKLHNQLRIGLGKIGIHNNSQQGDYVIRDIVNQRVHKVVNRINHFVNKITIKTLSKAFSNLMLNSSFSSISYLTDNQPKIRKISNDRYNLQIVRAKSKNQQSLRLSDLQMQPQVQSTSQLNPKKRNKQLKKEKVQLQRGLNDFYYKMNNLLNEHESNLRKK